MKIHSDILTIIDLQAALHTPTRIAEVYGEFMQVGSRSRSRGFIVKLTSSDETRPHKSGFANADTRNERAASWDDWGIWMDRLFDLDPNAIIGQYNGRDDFYSQTRRVRNYIREEYAPHTRRYKEHMASWLR